MHDPESMFREEIYQHLCKLAHRQLGHRRQGIQTLNTHALVHETFLKLSGHPQTEVRDDQHFYALAARAMRQIIIDYARSKSAKRRGGKNQPMSLDLDGGTDIPVEQNAEQLLALHLALEKLGRMDPRLEQVVEMRFFAGLEVKEVARLLHISEPTVKRDCRSARAFLLHAMEA